MPVFEAVIAREGFTVSTVRVHARNLKDARIAAYEYGRRIISTSVEAYVYIKDIMEVTEQSAQLSARYNGDAYDGFVVE